MVKSLNTVKGLALATEAESAVLDALREAPFVQIDRVVHTPPSVGHRPDIEITVRWTGGATTLLCEVRRSGQPSPARDALAYLSKCLAERPGTTGVLIAPYISKQVEQMSADLGIGTVDLSGNARLTFGNVYIRRSGKPNRFDEGREQRSAFAPKASRVLRVLLENPRESWQVQSLAREAGVSMGQASIVKQSLNQMEWLVPDRGVRLARPEEALRAWAASPVRIEAERVECFASKPAEAERKLFEKLAETGVRNALCGQSAAWLIAPMVKPVRTSIYIGGDLKTGIAAANLKVVPTGGNIVLIRPRDEGVFYKSNIVNQTPVVGAVQAFLDCSRSGGRGEEAAEAILDQRLRGTW